MIATIGTMILLAQSGLWIGDHHAAAATCCDVCGVEKAEILDLIAVLQNCPRWRARHDAAHDLRKFDWHCHPEIINALTTALITDCDDDVREESAQSLRKIAACTPDSHAALQRAARCDPDWATRFWARRALAVIKRKCQGECTVCQPSRGPLVLPAPLGEPVLAPSVVAPAEVMDPIPPGAALVPRGELPPPAPAPSPSPFVAPEIHGPDAAPPLEGPSREAKKTENRPRGSRVVKLIPGLRSRILFNEAAARRN